MNVIKMKTLVTENRKVYFEYSIEETIEAGIVLQGTEVKSLRMKQASIQESHVEEEGGELYLHGCFIPEYDKAFFSNHYPRRPRKLILHKREINRLTGLIERKGYAVVPVKIYFNKRNLVKVMLAVAKGKKQHDKRESIKERDWNRQKARVLKYE